MNWQEKINNYHEKNEIEVRKVQEDINLKQIKENENRLEKNTEHWNKVIIPGFEILDHLNTEQILKSFNEQVLENDGVVERTPSTINESNPDTNAKYKLTLNFLDSGQECVERVIDRESPDVYVRFLFLSKTSFEIIQKGENTNESLEIKIHRPRVSEYNNEYIKFFNFYNIKIERAKETVPNYDKKSKEEIIKLNQDMELYKERPYLFNTFYTRKPDTDVTKFIEENLIEFYNEIIKKDELSYTEKEEIKYGKTLPNNWEKCINKEQIKTILAKAKIDKELEVKTIPPKKRSFLDKLFG